ncbi:18231_t:CDS:2 [Gigaspora margarita]|uniref:18231_t:CDS:1 n=1 Tax=Gigaspora margarita TaxID=4874 RepID=A0ABM8VVI6_GIGMA|nr:18231_t:CDS:2 [Gigaspora margarita]
MLKKSGDETVLKNILEIVNKPDAQQENKPNKITDNPPEIYLNDKLLKHVEHNEYLLKSEHFKLISEWVYEVSRTVLRKFLAKLKFKVSNPSRAKRYKKAVIKLSSRHGPNFKDLRMTNGSQDGSRWRYSHKFYEKKIRDSEPDTFSVDDYEVFQVELKG